VDPTVQLIEDLADRALGRADRPVFLGPAVSSESLYRHLEAIEGNACVDEMPRPIGRNRFLKKVVLKLNSCFLVRQRAVNLATSGVVHDLVRAMETMQSERAHEQKRVAAALATIEPRLAAAAIQQRTQVEQLSLHVTSIEDRLLRNDQMLEASVVELRALLIDVEERRTAHVEELVRRLSDIEADVTLDRTRRRVLERAVAMSGRKHGTVADVAGPAKLVATARDASDDGTGDDHAGLEPDPLRGFDLVDLYDRFEARFRPSDVDLEQRFADYLADLAPLAGDLTASGIVVDIGTGRGELLRIMGRAGISCYGIDSNPHSVHEAVSAGLDVRMADLFAHLAGLPAESIGAIVALHVVEHLEPLDLLSMVDEAMRVLVPGGLIILETPNPTNLVVGASSFYHDPTHRRPVTPDYLAFVLGDRGFVDVETRFLHPLPEYELEVAPLPGPGMKSLDMLIDDVRWALKGPQDYSVLARRPSGR